MMKKISLKKGKKFQQQSVNQYQRKNMAGY